MREINRQLQEQRRLANKRCIEEDKERRTVRAVEYARADSCICRVRVVRSTTNWLLMNVCTIIVIIIIVVVVIIISLRGSLPSSSTTT